MRGIILTTIEGLLNARDSHIRSIRGNILETVRQRDGHCGPLIASAIRPME